MSRIITSQRMVTASDYDALCRLTVEKILATVSNTPGVCRIALSGGSTPKGIYQLMAGEYKDRFSWDSLHFYLSDERWVSLDHARSNYHMILSSGIPEKNVYPMFVPGKDINAAAKLYEQKLKDDFKDTPSFDICLLGLGEDGHVASLFPHNAALKENKRWVVPVKDASVPEERLSLTLPVINNSKIIIFCVSGSAKSRILNQVFQSKESDAIPATLVYPHNGQAWWFVDEQAAELIHV